MADQGENKIRFRDRKVYPVLWIILTAIWLILLIRHVVVDGAAVDVILYVALIIISGANALRWYIRRNHIKTTLDEDDDEDETEEDEDLAADL